ncbi:MAG: hypothetical protein M1814_000988 [Vezdaea aestivalis]|nr:MAG: hypothetical protein M1814_000988 [Vezdaea aestivalis]
MADFSMKSTLKLKSGNDIPLIGYGVYLVPNNITESVVGEALKSGYRHIDCATVYRNEAACATAMKQSGIPRSSIFFTSKVYSGSMSYKAAATQVEQSLQRTGLEYLDLYLIHAPYGGKAGRLGAWDALVEAQQAGKVKSIGVSNYGVHHLNELEAHIKEVEAKKGEGMGGVLSVGQWEIHPWLMRNDIVDWCKKRDVVIEAYSPLVRGQRFDEPTLLKLAEKYSKSPAQILGLVPLPKSATLERIGQNVDIFDFELAKDDFETLDTDEYAPSDWDPTTSND